MFLALSYLARSQEKDYSLLPAASFPPQLTHSFPVVSSFYLIRLLSAMFSHQLMNLCSSLPFSLADMYFSRAVAPKTGIHLFYYHGWRDASFITNQILPSSCLSFSCSSLSLSHAQPGMNCSPWTLFCRAALGLTVTASSEHLNLSLLNCILIFPRHFFSSFQTRALSCRLPAPPGFLLIIYSFVIITNKSTKQHQKAGRVLQNFSQ